MFNNVIPLYSSTEKKKKKKGVRKTKKIHYFADIGIEKEKKKNAFVNSQFTKISIRNRLV